jgi:hypothetical protein
MLNASQQIAMAIFVDRQLTESRPFQGRSIQIAYFSSKPHWRFSLMVS